MRDKKVIEGLAKGEQDAMAYLYTSLQLRAFSILQPYGAKPDEAMTVLADLLIDLTTRIQAGNFSLRDATLNTYCLTACKYIWWERKKKSDRHNTLPPLPLLMEDSDLSRTIFGVRQDLLLRRAIGKLPDNCNGIIMARFYPRQSKWDEVAEITGYRKTSIRHAGKRCIDKLKEIWEKLMLQHDVLMKND